MYKYIEQRINEALKTLYDNLEYDFEYKICPIPNKNDEAAIYISSENVFIINKQNLIIVVSRQYLHFYIPDLITMEKGNFEFLNELNLFCDLAKLRMDEHGNVSAEYRFFTGQYNIGISPMLLIVPFKAFVKEIEKLLTIMSNDKQEGIFIDGLIEPSLENAVTVTKAAELFGVSRSTISFWVQSGYIEAEKIKGKWMINNDSLKRFKTQWDSGF
ncbi:hypothetical protein ASG99_12435 [Bacillus sp. Soil768D1]|nr:hypothetical protein ASG99_12435 [Bacillus sp. Soil768D1]